MGNYKKLKLKQTDQGSDLKQKNNKEKSNLSQKAAKLDHTESEEKTIIKSSGRKKGDKEKKIKVEATKSDLGNVMFDDEENGERQNGKLSRKRKANKVGAIKSGVEKADKLNHEGDLSDQNISQESAKMRKKRRKNEKRKNTAEDIADEIRTEVEDDNAKGKDSRKKKKKTRALSRKDEKVLEEKVEPEEDDAFEMSSGDEDCSTGMKKWITEYHQSRPGLKVLQDQIDDFITAHEEQQEKARKEREEQAAEGGWTVVVHHKGRKKTTEAESGTVVGSVAPAAVLENMAKKKNNQVGIDFYRFQKREARMNEIMALQSKFEEDKKRIKEMRDARKFRPY